MYLKFSGPTDLTSWAHDYRLKLSTIGDDDAVVSESGWCIYQHNEDRLAVTITRRWAWSRQKLIVAGGEVVQDGDAEGTVASDPHDTEASLAVLRILRRP